MFNQRREPCQTVARLPKTKEKMKKTSLYMMALLTMGFAACNDDFPTEFVPQTNAPENAFPANAVSAQIAIAKAVIEAINAIIFFMSFPL